MIFNSALRAALLCALIAGSLSADITYTKTVRYTGGSMLSFLRNLVGNPLIHRMVGADLETALADQSYTVYVKGSKMSQVAEGGFTIYDLDAGTITVVDSDAQTYTVESFDDLRAQIERAEQWMKHPKNGPVTFDIRIEKTDVTRTFDGRPAGKNLITLTAQSDNAWGKPVVNVAAWLVPVDATTRLLYDFSKRASEKLSSVFTIVPSFFGAAANNPVGSAPNSPKLRGISVLDEISVTGVTTPLAGLLGNRESRANTPVIVLEIQSSNFSSAPVDGSRFAVPAGYRREQQQHR